MKEVRTGVYTKDDNTFNFNFYTDLSVANKLKFVNSVVELIVNDKHYNSVIRNLIFDFYVIDIFTDIDTTELKDSLTFLDDVEQYLEETNIVEIVKANAVPTLFDELNKAVDNSVAYLTGVRPSPLSDALANLVTTLEQKIGAFDMNNVMEMVQKFVGMTDELTPESIMNVYMNSDMHKQNVEEIEEVKRQRTEFAEDMDKTIKAVKKEAISKNKK